MTSAARQEQEVLHLKREHLEAMLAHARAEAPFEACGALGGRDGRVEKVYPAQNAEKSPALYRMVPEEQLQIFLEIEGQGWELVGIYHSHPGGPAYPSATDLELAYYPEAVYVILSLVESPAARAFRIVEGVVTPVEMEVSD